MGDSPSLTSTGKPLYRLTKLTMQDLTGKVAVITGGVSGIGFAIARALAVAGMRVAVTYRNEVHLREVIAWFHEHASAELFPVRLEVTDRCDCMRAAEEIERFFGKIHVLCSNAGVAAAGRSDETLTEDWDAVLGVNLWGTINVLNAFVPRIRSHGEGGHIVNVASVAAFVVDPMTGVYATSKFALRGLSANLRLELACHRIGVSLLCPGLTRTRIHEGAVRRTGTADIPSKLLGVLNMIAMDPDEVARRTLRGILQNDALIFTHTEFKEEIQEIDAELLTAVMA